MAITFARECLFPEDLEAATRAMQELIADRFRENLALIDAAEAAAGDLDSLLDEGNRSLQELLLQGDSATNIRTLTDLTNEFGLLDETATLSQKEAFGSQSGVIIFDSVVYLPGSKSPDTSMSDNISILRKIFLSCGRSLAITEEILKNPRSVVTHSAFSVQEVRAKRPGVAFSLDEIKSLLSDPYITADAVTVLEDFSSLVLRKRYLSINDSIQTTSRRTGLPEDNIVVSVFHQDAVDNSTASINRFQNLGFSGPKLSAILASQDLVDSAQSPIEASLQDEYAEAASLIELENFVAGRYASLDNTTKTNFRNRIEERLSSLYESHLGTLTDAYFWVSTIREHNTLDKLREKHSDAAIVRLLEERTDITGLWWNPPDSVFDRTLAQAVQSAPPGSSTISNRYLNGLSLPKVNLSEFMAGLGDLSDASLSNAFPKQELSTSTRNLTEFQGRSPIRNFSSLRDGAALASASESAILSDINPSTTADAVTRASGFDSLSGQPPPVAGGVVGSSVSSGEPLQGQPSGTSPSAVLTDLFDPGKTLGLEERLNSVNTTALADLSSLYPPEMAAPLARIANILSDLFRQSMATCARAVETARARILPLKGKLDSFMSKFLTLTGSGNYQKSLLKCVTVNVGLSLPELDNLFGITNKIAAVGGAFLSAVSGWSNNLVDKIICLSTSFLDQFLGVTNALPAGCIAPRIDLGNGLASSLNALKFVGVAKTSVFGTFGRDTVRLKVMVESTPTKVKQFTSGAGCSGPQLGDFFNKAMLQVKIPKPKLPKVKI